MSKKHSAAAGPKKQERRRKLIISIMAGFLVLVMLIPMISMIFTYSF